MTPPTERRHGIDATSAPSASSNVDETALAGASSAGTAVPGFGPPAAHGEVGTLGPYRVVKELGKGGMGAVYAAIDTRLDRRLALKVMLPQFAAEPAARERFLREARAAARVKHDHVVTVYEADERDGVPYIAMEYLEGYPLDEYLKKKGNPTPAQVLKLAAETAAGLAAAHRQGLVHRDVKPGNLWLEAPQGRVKVLDFGLARPVDAEVELTKSGAIVGTPAYMSPEQARGEKVDHRTDLFSLGAVLYRLVTGRLPFQAPNTMAMLIALGTEEPPPVRSLNPAVPEPLAELIHQLLAKTPDARPASADEVVKRLRAMLSARSAPAAPAPSVVYVPIQVTAVPEANPFADLDATEPEPAPAAAPAKPRRSWAVAAGLAAMMLVVFGGVIIIIRNRDGSETKIEVPDGATVTLKDKGGKVLAKVGPGTKAPPVADNSPDRKTAEYVLSVGGTVGITIDEKESSVIAAADLPRERFTLNGVFLQRVPASAVGPVAFAGCTGLLHVSLMDTPVTDADLAPLKDCPRLRTLELSGTKVTGAGLAHVAGLPDLTNLSLMRAPVTDAGLAQVSGFRSLTSLGLSDTAVTDAGLARFHGCAELRALYLGQAPVTDAGLAGFRGCKHLVELGIDGTKVTDAGLAALPNAGMLTHLNASGTAVTDAGLAHLRACEKLGMLMLRNTRVTDAGLAHLRELKGLTALDVTATKVTAKGLADFHAAVPGCKIEHDGGVIEAIDVDRRAAEWVVSVGGTVRVNGEERGLKAAADLPKGAFALTWADLWQNPKVTDDGLANFKGCRNLLGVSVGHAREVTDRGLANFRDSTRLTYLNLTRTQVTPAGLAHFKDCADLAYLDLYGTATTDDAVPAVLAHKNLTVLGLGSTRLTDAGLARLTELKKLTQLNLQEMAQVTDASLLHVKGVPELEHLALTRTSVTDAGVVHLKELRRLTTLVLTDTKVTAKGAADFHAAVPGCRVEHDGGVIEPVDVDRKLAEWVIGRGGSVIVGGQNYGAGTKNLALPGGPIRLAGVKLKDAADLDGLGDGGRLTWLSLDNSGATDAAVARVKGYRSLTFLGLNNTPVTDAALAHLAGHPTLEIVSLNGTGVTDAGLAHFRTSAGLKGVNLWNTKVTDAGLSHLAAAKGLEHLNLSGTAVTDAGLAHLAPHRRLVELRLRDTAVTDAGLARLHGCGSLTYLEVNRTKVTAKGLADFHAAVPGCRVEHDGGVIEAIDVDRRAAEYVVSLGGVLRIDGQDRDFKTAADLPKERFTLATINLYGLKVTDAELARFKDCRGLRQLGLGDVAQVTDAGLAYFKDCKGLRDLWLSGTGVTDAGLAHFKDCEGVTGLDLRGTKVTDAGLAHFKDHKALTALHLFGTRVTDAGLAHFQGCKGLVLLSLSDRGVTDAGLAHFKDCKGLTYLGLGGTGVTDAGLAHFKDCGGLRSLSLKGTRVTDVGLVHLKDCKGLTTVSLQGTAVTDAGLAVLKGCNGLQTLDLRGTKVTAAGLADFHAAVSGCRVEHDGGVIEPRK